MAKLPTVEAFGPRPSSRAPRRVHAFRADIVQKAEAKGLREVSAEFGKAAKEFGKLGQDIADAEAEEREKLQRQEIEREALTLDTQFSDGLRALQLGDGTDQNPGFLNLQGQAAVDGREDYVAGVDRLLFGTLAQASSPRVRARIGSPLNSRRNSALNRGATHFGNQRDVATAAAFDASAAATADDAAVLGAAGDTEGLLKTAQLAGIKAARFAGQTGADPELSAERAVTKILTAEIQRRALVAPDTARAFFDEHSESIDGRTHNSIERMLQSAERERDAGLARDVRDAVFVIERGEAPPDLAALQARTRGTEAGETLGGAVEDAAAVQEFMRKPLAEQRQTLKAERKTATRRDVRLKERLQRTHANMVSELKKGNGLALAGAIGVISEPQPLDLSDPTMLRDRAVQARVASAHFGVDIAPLSPSESDNVVEQLRSGPLDEATGILRGLVEGLGRDGAGRVAADVVEKDPEIAMAIVSVADRPLLAREILSGGRLLGENKDIRPKSTDRQDAAATVLGNVLLSSDTAGIRAPVLAAADAVYAARRVPTADFGYDADTYEAAIRDVTGGILEHNGRNIIAPVPNMEQDAFDDLLDKLTQPDLARFGNGEPVFANGDRFPVELLQGQFFGTEAQFISSGFDGVYLVLMPGRGFVMVPSGDPYEIDFAGFTRGGVRPQSE